MAPRANWKGYLRLSLVSCPIALRVCVPRCGSGLSTQMQCSTLPCCCNEKTNTRRLQLLAPLSHQ